MGEIQTIGDLIVHTALFADMKADYRKLVAGCGQLVHFQANEFLLREGEEANYFFIIRHGTVSIESHMAGRGELVVSKISEGGVAGFSWLFPPYRNTFDVRAEDAVAAIQFDGTCLRNKAEADHELGYQFMKRFAALMVEHVNAAHRQMLDIYG